MNDYLALHELYHHGIKGQKWGVRRFQNEDGTLTAEGKERYNKDSEGHGLKELNSTAGECNKSDVLKKAKCKITVNKDNANDPDSCQTCWTVLDDKGKPIEFNGSTSLWDQEVGDVLWDRLGRPATGSELSKQINSIKSKLEEASKKQKKMLDPEYEKHEEEFDKLMSELHTDVKNAKKNKMNWLGKYMNHSISQDLDFSDTEDYLSHHGIKGQKWGVRRFQNKDGSLTDEGKRRYYDATGIRTKEGEEDLAGLEKTMKSQADQMSSLLKKYDVKDPERLDERNFDKDGMAYDNYWDYTSNLRKYAELNGHTDIDEKDVELYNKLYKERKQDMKTYSYLSISDRSGKNDFVTIGKDIAKFTLMPFITLKLLYLGKTSMDIETAKQNSKERKIYSGKNSSVQHSYFGDYIDNAENYLSHHGIKGQRWGVRRYQNADGTLTDEGKARYGIGENGRMSREGKKLYKQDTKDQLILDSTDQQNANRAASKTATKYFIASTATLAAGLFASVHMNKIGNYKGEELIDDGYRVAQAVLAAVGTVHTLASASKARKERSKILESQKDTPEDIEAKKKKAEDYAAKEKEIRDTDSNFDDYCKKLDKLSQDEIVEYFEAGENAEANREDYSNRLRKNTQDFLDENSDKLKELEKKTGVKIDINMVTPTQKEYFKNPKKYTYITDLVDVDGHDISLDLLDFVYALEDIQTNFLSVSEGAHFGRDRMYHSDDELAHFGIFGMKWGIRRFQNKDGTLTEAGKVRYKANPDGAISPKGEGRARYNADVNDPRQLMVDDVGSAVSTTAGAAKGVSEQIRNIPTKTGSVVRGKYSNISDAELQKRINRLSLEQRYSDLVGDTHYVKSGGEKVKEIFQTVGATAGIIAALTPLTIFVASHMYKKK